MSATATEIRTEHGKRRAAGPPRIGRKKRYKGLPTWDEMGDMDKGAALLHVYRSTWSRNARKTLYCKYTQDERLVALSEKERSKHAHFVTGGHARAQSAIPPLEYRRLCKIAGNALG